MPQPSPNSPVAIAAQGDPAVQAAMRQITAGAEELHRALAALGATTPHLSAVLPLLAPSLAAKAVQQGHPRRTATVPTTQEN